MNLKEAARAIEVLAVSPAAKWIGNRVLNDGVWLQKCMRCDAEETLVFPPDIRGPADVPAGFDEKLFAWKRAFQVAHEGCVETPPLATDMVSVEQHVVPTPLAVGACSTEQFPVMSNVAMKRVLFCESHGTRTWQGHVMCDACGRTYQTADSKKPVFASEVCRCGQRLLPPVAERVGDVLGLRTGGIVLDEEGHQYQTPKAQDWTARPICYLCHRYFVKHHGGRVPVERGRN